jgi:tetratricopeptide (TPR) repeat protein
VGGENVGIVSKLWHGWALWMGGYPDRAMRTCEGAVSLAKQIGQPFSLALAFSWSSVLHWNLCDEEKALELAEAAIEIAELHGFPVPLGVARLVRLRFRPAEEMAEMIAQGEQILADLGATGTQAAVPQILCGFAEFCSKMEMFDVAKGYLDIAFVVSASTGQPHWDAELYRAKAENLLLQQIHDVEEAESLLRRAVKTAAAQGAKILELRAATRLAVFLKSHGREGEALDALETVFGWFSEGFEVHDLVTAKALLEELSVSRGE